MELLIFFCTAGAGACFLCAGILLIRMGVIELFRREWILFRRQTGRKLRRLRGALRHRQGGEICRKSKGGGR